MALEQSDLPVELKEADAFLPAFDWEDENKRRYLSWRLTGFSRKEALVRTGIVNKTVQRWRRDDSAFEAVDSKNLAELRKTFSKEVITLDFTRNFKMVLERDFKILTQALDDSTQLSKDDRDYLTKIRPLYTPQALVALESLFAENKGFGGWDELLSTAQEYAIIVRNRDGQETGYTNSENGGSP